MKLHVFCLLLVLVVVPTWFALNCSLFQEPRSVTSVSNKISSYLVPKPVINKLIKTLKHAKAPKAPEAPSLNRFKGTTGYIWVRDLDMVATTSGYVWHRDMPNREIMSGGGTVDLPVRMDRAGVAKGLIFSRTKAKLECTATVNETVLYIYIFHSEAMGNLHEGIFAIFMALKETEHLDKPFRISFLERWGSSNQDYIKTVFPNFIRPAMHHGDITEHHPVDFLSPESPEVIDGLCFRELIVVKDQFPIFPPPSRRSLIAYRRHLLSAFGVAQPLEQATRQKPKFVIPPAAQSDKSDAAPAGTKMELPRVVLIKRSKDKMILNSAELLKGMRAQLKGLAEIQQVALEQLSPEEVVALLQGTTVLIGTHGSGMAHLWFLPRTSSLIEIHPPGASEMFTPNSFANGAPWLVDYVTIADKLRMNTFIHEVEKVVEPIDDCGEGRWGLYCAYLKNVEVDVKQLAGLTKKAIEAALARKEEQFK